MGARKGRHRGNGAPEQGDDVAKLTQKEKSENRFSEERETGMDTVYHRMTKARREVGASALESEERVAKLAKALRAALRTLPQDKAHLDAGLAVTAYALGPWALQLGRVYDRMVNEPVRFEREDA
jgi:hypothetical protein